MANKKAKEEVTQSSQPKVDSSNKEREEEWREETLEEMNKFPKAPTMEDFENSEQNKKAADMLEEELAEAAELEEAQKKNEEEEQPQDTPKLHVLADDRLNSLINTANELGITDVVQILNSDRTGQFYMVYKA